MSARKSNIIQTKSRSEYLHQVEKLLEKSVCQQMVADVPVGAFLSGEVTRPSSHV